jgi:hypothetical protein
MANINAPSGLRAVRHMMGGVVRANQYAIAPGLASNIFTGDPVKTDQTGVGAGTGKAITVCGATDVAVGVFYGCQYQEADGNIVFRRYWPSGQTTLTNSAITAYVYDDPHILFEIQASGSFAATNVGSEAPYLLTTAGSTATGQSGAQLDSGNYTTSGTSNLKIIELANRSDNAYGTNAKVLVLINKHELNAAVAAV